MNEKTKLVLEILSGPLDGATVTIQEESDWASAGEGPLIFPWDLELGQPQARFVIDESGWQLKAFASPHGTYRINENERLSAGSLPLAEGDLLKGSDTWLLVRQLVYAPLAKAVKKEPKP